jgi:serine O-acetyltransferase
MKLLLDILSVLFLLFVVKTVLLAIIFRKEVRFAMSKDPSASGFLEVLLLYPGIHALMYHRVAHFFYRIRLLFLARAIGSCARFFTGIEIHPGALVGSPVFIDHGMGVVVGETAVIGNNVLLYQGVTLGGTGLYKGKRHPTIGNNVVVGGGAKVLGNITVGENSYIGANAVVISDVPQNATVVGVPGRITKQDGKKIEVKLDHVHVLDPIMQQIEELEKKIEKLEH